MDCKREFPICSPARRMSVTGSDLELVVRVTHVPFKGNQFTFCVTHDACHVAAELWVVARKQDQTGKDALTKFIDGVLIAPLAVDLPIR